MQLSRSCSLFSAAETTTLLTLRGGKRNSWWNSVFSQVKKLFSGWFAVSPKKSFKGRKQSAKSSPRKSNNASPSSLSRLQKEAESFLAHPPHNCQLSVGANLRSWVVTLTGVEGTIYDGEVYKLKLNFPKEYPAKPPSVYFLKPVPRHVHVYSNGDICLNLLGRDWSPAMTAEGLVVSILSMLSSAKEKTIPQDNAMHASEAPGKQQDNWMYHDDRC
eukprot:scaffold3595_cov235-Ochromonas_danica.AAC.1